MRPAASRGSRAAPGAAWAWVTMCTSMDPDRAVTVDPDAGREQLREPAAAGGAEDELGGVLGAGEGEQGGGDVVADDVVVGAAEALDEGALAG